MHAPRSQPSRKQLPASRWRQRRLAQAESGLSAAQERQLATLHEISTLLAGQHAIDALCRGFLHHVMQFAQAEGGTVRILDPQHDTVHIIVHEGISDAMVEEEHCIRNNDCLCGAAVAQGVIQIRDFRQVEALQRFRCQDEGFVAIAVFPILAREQVVGSFSLHFARPQAAHAQQQGWLETLGQSLGIAIENQRLIAREKEFAVARERSLLAEGLHDSIAQSLNFISLQVQMLDDSVRRGQLDEAAEVLPLMRMGVEQSYQDVRELLVNFRTRWHGSDLESKLSEVLAKFELQTGVVGTLDMSGNGAPLAPEQQLQILFIVQVRCRISASTRKRATWPCGWKTGATLRCRCATMAKASPPTCATRKRNCRSACVSCRKEPSGSVRNLPSTARPAAARRSRWPCRQPGARPRNRRFILTR